MPQTIAREPVTASLDLTYAANWLSQTPQSRFKTPSCHIAKEMIMQLDNASRPFMYGKLHRVTVTGADLDYVGSITIDPKLLRASGLLPYTQVDVVNITNGERIQTYIIEGREGAGTVCLNGAAAHQFSKGDLAIIMGYEGVPADQLEGRISRAVHVDSKNAIVSIDEYRVPALADLGKPEACREGEVYQTVAAE